MHEIAISALAIILLSVLSGSVRDPSGYAGFIVPLAKGDNRISGRGSLARPVSEGNSATDFT